ncbi:MAG: hypothetical protein HQL32_12065 [Planctomycetes bacterium]|nr:hypothetical protein [Planctomycetota bacterium]
MIQVKIVHHHLKTGGVTKVIQSQLKSFIGHPIEVSLVVGDENSINAPHKEQIVIPELNYLEKNLSKEQLHEEYTKLLNALRKVINKDDIIHIHNLNLGKNPLLNLAMLELHSEGYRIINHCHDFAEDNRPANMQHLEKVVEGCFKQKLKEVMYPKSHKIKYAIINTRDRQHLEAQGVSPECIFDFANPIEIPKLIDSNQALTKVKSDMGLDQNDKRPLYLYPVRVIRRKNIGEFILLTALFPKKAHWCVTLPPQNPVEKESYDEWKRFCLEQKIETQFDVGTRCDFVELMNAAERIVTTSIREGFGMVFLESWLYNKGVMGRDIPDITVDFKDKGIQFNHLYNELIIRGKDFAAYSQQEQMTLISEIIVDPTLQGDVIKTNQLDHLFAEVKPESIKHNHDNIVNHYSLSSYGQNCKTLYEKPF